MCSKEEEEWPRPVRSLLIIFFMFDRNIMKWMCKKRVLGRRKTTWAEQVFHVSVLMYIMSRSIKWQKSQLAAAKERASGRGKHATSELESLAETFVSLGDLPVSAVLPQWMCTLFDQRGTAEAVPIEQNEEDETTEEKSRWRETFCIIALSPPPRSLSVSAACIISIDPWTVSVHMHQPVTRKNFYRLLLTFFF